ncbi:MAG: alpha-amylase family protein [Bacteroidaceae bacterium]|nr:alpha-amylase family protein [Bacteroidaceae bacterium]
MSKIIIYQLLPRLFGNDTENCIPAGDITTNGCGKFNKITTKALGEIKKLGVTHVWYTGIIEHATCTDYSAYGITLDHPAVVKGKAGSPYAIKDYYDADPDLAEDIPARREEFRALVNRTHDAGMKVIMDFIPNHVARHYESDNRPKGTYDFGAHDEKDCFFKGHNNFYYLGNQPFGEDIDTKCGCEEAYSEIPMRATGNDCFGIPHRNDWYETVKLNYGIDYSTGQQQFTPIPDTWVKMVKILLYWASQGIDGFRCDMVELTPVAFWQWAVPQVKEQYPDIIFIGEVYQPHLYRSYIYQGHFDYLYDKVGLYDTLRAKCENRGNVYGITSTLQQTADISKHMLTFLENHDEQRIASDFFAGDGFNAVPALIVSATVGVQPFMFYAGQELGEKGMDAEGFSGTDGRTTIFDYWSVDTLRRWSNKGKYNDARLTADEKRLQKIYSQILNLCNSEEALSDGTFYDLQYANPNSAHYDAFNVYSYIRATEKEFLLIAVNFSKETRIQEIRIPSEAFTYHNIEPQEKSIKATELLSGKSIKCKLHPDATIPVTIPALGGVILKFKLS